MSASGKVRRVLFTIACFRAGSTGNGGHYYSLRTMAEALEMDHQILVIGDFFPPALQDCPGVLFVSCAFSSIRGPDFDSIPELEKADLIHAYDLTAANFSARLSWMWKVPLVFTKPGGPPYKSVTRMFENMTVFYQQDYDLISGRKSPPRNLILIPNRVNLDATAGMAVGPVFEGAPNGALKIITIGRIGKVYDEKIRQAIALRRAIAARHGPAVLSIIGVVEDADTLEALRRDTAQDGADVRFFTEDEITKVAARHLAASDVAVCTGRGFMEALGYGNFVFFTVRGPRLPCFAHDDNYAEAFRNNFSPRVTETDTVNCAEAFERFLGSLDPAGAAAYRAWARDTFTRDHDVHEGARRLKTFYGTLSGHETLIGAYVPTIRFWLFGLIKKHILRRY